MDSESVAPKDSDVFAGVVAIEYDTSFKWDDLNPKIGNIFRFFIDQNFFRPSHSVHGDALWLFALSAETKGNHAAPPPYDQKCT